MSIQKQDKKAVDNKLVPWYLGRKFWGIILVLITSPSILFIFTDSAIKTKIYGYFLNMPIAFDVVFGWFFTKNIGKYFYIIYYIILFIVLFKTFANKKVKIKYPILFSILMLISFMGMIIMSIPS
ncbi:MAG: hypothetical protein Q8P20_01595 [bacterium]|nr:hypothetical protein [bacterium]